MLPKVENGERAGEFLFTWDSLACGAPGRPRRRRGPATITQMLHGLAMRPTTDLANGNCRAPAPGTAQLPPLLRAILIWGASWRRTNRTQWRSGGIDRSTSPAQASMAVRPAQTAAEGPWPPRLQAPALKAKDLAAAKALLRDPEITVPRGRQDAWAWRPRPSTAICRGRAPRPWKPELRLFYPIDWPQISHWVRFVRAKGAGGMRRNRPGGTAEVARSPRLPWTMCRSGRPRSCWRLHISITTRPTVDAGIATSGRFASAAICCMTGRSTAGGSG